MTEKELDIVDELRFFAEACDTQGITVAMLSGRTFADAADEIERLRSPIAEKAEDVHALELEERLRNEQVVEERLGPFRTFKVGARNYDEMKRQALEAFDIADLISGKYMRQCKGCISFDGSHHCEGFWPGMFLDEAAAEIERLRSKPSQDLVKQLRDRACPAGLPYTGDNPEEDHGHTDCWLHHQAADEIERLRALIAE